MSSPIPIRATQREADCRLRTVNHNIEKLAQSPPGANVCLVFASAAKLAGEAIQAAAELRCLHRARNLLPPRCGHTGLEAFACERSRLEALQRFRCTGTRL